MPPVPPFRRLGPDRPVTPLVVAVPHAGRHYPADVLADAAVPLPVLQQLEDRFADRLLGPLLAREAVAVVAEVARAAIDLNRAPDEVDEAGPRARSGLGLVPTRLDGRALWRRPPTAAAVAERLAAVHEPYHRAVGEALAVAVGRHGRALLIDCHSMPTLRGPAPARVVVGDLNGRTAARAVTEAALAAARGGGLPAALNSPYAGAYTLQRHGAPADGVDALQVEIDRALYLDPVRLVPSAGVDRMAAMLARLAEAALQAQRPCAIAAE